MKAFVIRLMANAVAIFAAVKLLPGLHFHGTAVQLAGRGTGVRCAECVPQAAAQDPDLSA